MRFTRIIRFPSTECDSWDGLGHRMATLPKSPLWKRWRINYDANLDEFNERAKLLDELRSNLTVGPKDRLRISHFSARNSGK